MEFKVIKRNGNAVIPDGMFKLCGMEDAKLISMVQLNGGILLMPESVSIYQLLMLVDALNKLACDFLEVVAIECGPAEEEHRDMTLDEVLSEFAVAVPDWARESAGIAKNAKLECYTDDGSGAVLVQKASHRHDLTRTLVSLEIVTLVTLFVCCTFSSAVNPSNALSAYTLEDVLTFVNWIVVSPAMILATKACPRFVKYSFENSAIFFFPFCFILYFNDFSIHNR